MAFNDIFELLFSLEGDSGCAVTSLYYKQIRGLPNDEADGFAQVADDFFGANPGPWNSLALFISDKYTVTAVRVTKLRPVPFFPVSKLVNSPGQSLQDPFPTALVMQCDFASEEQPFERDFNRIYISGWIQTLLDGAGYAGSLNNFNDIVLKFFREFGTTLEPSLPAWRLQHRKNTGGAESEVQYSDASEPFLRCFPTRLKSRTPSRSC